MKKRTTNKTEIREIAAPAKPIVPLFSNVTAAYSHENFVVFDFGFVSPTYNSKEDVVEDIQIVRLCMPWDAVQDLYDTISEVLQERSKDQKKSQLKSRKNA